MTEMLIDDTNFADSDVEVPTQPGTETDTQNQRFMEAIAARRMHAQARLLLAWNEKIAAEPQNVQWPEFKQSLDAPPLRKFLQSRSGQSLRYREAELTKSSEDNKRDATEIANEYVASRNSDTFKQKLESKRKAAEAEAIKQNNEFWDKVEQAGRNLPSEQQDQLLTVADKIQAVAHWLWSQVSSFIVDLFNKAIAWLREAAKNVAAWFAGVGSKVTNFFKDLFG